MLDELEIRSGLGSDRSDAHRSYFLPAVTGKRTRDTVRPMLELLSRISPTWDSRLQVHRVEPWTAFEPLDILELDTEEDGSPAFAVRLTQARVGRVWVLEADAGRIELTVAWVAAKLNQAVSMYGRTEATRRMLAPGGIRLRPDPWELGEPRRP